MRYLIFSKMRYERTIETVEIVENVVTVEIVGNVETVEIVELLILSRLLGL